MEQDSVNEPDVAPAPPAPISDDNIGSRMLKAMGWVGFYHKTINKLQH